MSTKRTPRACERCRRTRRRCQPPHPCPACLAAGVCCEVRVKARPKRAKAPCASLSGMGDDARITITLAESKSPMQRGSTNSFSTKPSRKAAADVFEQVHELVRTLLKKDCDYNLHCPLVEPQPPGPVQPRESTESQLSYHIELEHVKSLLVIFERFNGADLINVKELLSKAHFTDLLIGLPLRADRVLELLKLRDLPLDSAAVVFTALAIGATLSGEANYGTFCFDTSTILAKEHVGTPSYDLCLAYFLQHHYILRAGTLNHAHAAVAHTVQACHDLALHHGSHGVRGLHLYLLVYMADQYSSLTYSSAPLIQSSTLPSGVFDLLSSARPHLKPLIDLLIANGRVLEHCYHIATSSTQDMPFSEILKLEAMIGAAYSKRQAAISERKQCKNFSEMCEPIARIHMLLCRIRLRTPGLSNPETWVPSISITTHAAVGVLTTYFQLYLPPLHVLANRAPGEPPLRSASHGLPATWRQVKRIMLCVLIIVLAYWHGEIAHDEASRYMAMARLSLEYHRVKWGNKLREVLLVTTDVSRLAGFCLQDHMQTLLPTENPDFPLPIEEDFQNLSPSDTLSPQNMDATGNVSQTNDKWSADDAACSFAQWTLGIPDLTLTSEFDWTSNLDSLGLWQFSEGAMESAHFAI